MKHNFDYSRRTTTTVNIGGLKVGSDHPIMVQTMTNTPTDNTERSVAQILRVAEAGGELVRLTAQGSRQAQNLSVIRRELDSRGCSIPLCADIHFNADLALEAARSVEKVRINPGNYAQKERLRDKFVELLDLCKEQKRALRVGVNHGSLSSRIVEQYGDTPRGMVESAMEFLRIASEEEFGDVVVSLKSSNPRIMVESYRLAAQTMDSEGLNYPLHIGVTEAGEGDDGRIRSAVGIGALLADGLGDTIRVSLTEDPEAEIPVAEALARYYDSRGAAEAIAVDIERLPYDPLVFSNRYAGSLAAVVGRGGDFEGAQDSWHCVSLDDLTPQRLEQLKRSDKKDYIVLSSDNVNWTGEIRAAISRLMISEVENPVILHRNYPTQENVEIYSAADMGSILIDALAQGVWIEAGGQLCDATLGLSILQACRLRLTKTEIISCPGCGRTLFDLQECVLKVKERFSNYPGLKIAVMGCIVNGPGEMADADFGYVGSGHGLVTLYRGQSVYERGIPQNEALDRLALLIESTL
ncbi:MAG: (E)-4-hydroxy-3-methylbut-2-enyl-diphosphate synthase [Rikenellaceae bacterium]